MDLIFHEHSFLIKRKKERKLLCVQVKKVWRTQVWQQVFLLEREQHLSQWVDHSIRRDAFSPIFYFLFYRPPCLCACADRKLLWAKFKIKQIWMLGLISEDWTFFNLSFFLLKWILVAMSKIWCKELIKINVKNLESLMGLKVWKSWAAVRSVWFELKSIYWSKIL